MGSKKDVHISGALASLLNSGDISTLESVQKQKKESSTSFTNNYFPDITSIDKHNNVICEINPNEIQNWAYHDRPDTEVGDIDSLAQEFLTIGQQQPCIVRPIKNSEPFSYEVIAGQRRWLAAKRANIKLKVLIKDLTDHEAALCQAGENSQRIDLSDYAKGMNYSKLVNAKIIDRSELQDKLKISKSMVRNLLSFEKIDDEIWHAIGDYSKISASTAYEMSRLLADPSEPYRDALIAIAPSLSGKNISDKKLRTLVINYSSAKSKQSTVATEIKTHNGRHIFTWRKDSNGNRSIAFPKNVRSFLDYEKLTQSIRLEIEHQLNKIEHN